MASGYQVTCLRAPPPRTASLTLASLPALRSRLPSENCGTLSDCGRLSCGMRDGRILTQFVLPGPGWLAGAFFAGSDRPMTPDPRVGPGPEIGLPGPGPSTEAQDAIARGRGERPLSDWRAGMAAPPGPDPPLFLPAPSPASAPATLVSDTRDLQAAHLPVHRPRQECQQHRLKRQAVIAPGGGRLTGHRRAIRFRTVLCESREAAFRMVAIGAFKGPLSVLGAMRLDTRQHHHRPAFRAGWPFCRYRSDGGESKSEHVALLWQAVTGKILSHPRT